MPAAQRESGGAMAENERVSTAGTVATCKITWGGWAPRRSGICNGCFECETTGTNIASGGGGRFCMVGSGERLEAHRAKLRGVYRRHWRPHRHCAYAVLWPAVIPCLLRKRGARGSEVDLIGHCWIRRAWCCWVDPRNVYHSQLVRSAFCGCPSLRPCIHTPRFVWMPCIICGNPTA